MKEFLWNLVFIFILALPLSHLFFLIMMFVYDILLKIRNEPSKVSNESFDHLYGASFIVALLLSGFIMIGSPLDTASSQSTARSSNPPKAYIEYPDPATLPTFNIEIPTLSDSFFDSFEAIEPPNIVTKNASIDFVSYPVTAHRNEKVTVKIYGEPNTVYDITVTYSSGISTADGLHPKTSDSKGYVYWWIFL